MDNEFYNDKPNKSQNGYAIASLVLGILSIVCCCSPYISAAMGVISIVFFVIDKKNTGKANGMAIAGLICGIFGLFMAVISIIVSFTSFSESFLNDYMSMLESMMSDIENMQ